MDASTIRRCRTAALRAFAQALCNDSGSDAQSLAGTVIIASNTGQSVEVSDESAIPAGLRGCVQLALVAATVSPAGTMTRSSLAFALDPYRTAFAAGN
jgi:hypothetical protein